MERVTSRVREAPHLVKDLTASLGKAVVSGRRAGARVGVGGAALQRLGAGPGHKGQQHKQQQQQRWGERAGGECEWVARACGAGPAAEPN